MFLLATTVIMALGFSVYHYSKKYETPTTPIVPKTAKKVEEVVKVEEPVKKTRKPRVKKITTKKKKNV